MRGYTTCWHQTGEGARYKYVCVQLCLLQSYSRKCRQHTHLQYKRIGGTSQVFSWHPSVALLFAAEGAGASSAGAVCGRPVNVSHLCVVGHAL